MNVALDVLIIAIVAIAAFFAGYFFGKSQAYQHSDLGAQTTLLSDLKTQLVEVKTKFSEVEKRREELAKAQDKVDAEKEKRHEEFVKAVQKFFDEREKRRAETDLEKDKRMADLMEATRKFFQEQEKSRETTEKARDEHIQKFGRIIEAFTRTVHGTSTRGQAGEELLKQALKSSIKAGLVETGLRTEGGVVEFAWVVGQGKYIPIDAKFPDITELLDALAQAEGVADQKALKKQVYDKLRKQIDTVRKYQNQSKTINHCVLVVPEGAIETSPELIAYGASQNVHVCSVKEVFLISYLIADAYQKLQEEGDVGELKAVAEQLLVILDQIMEKTDTIDRGLKIAQKATDEVKGKVREGKRL